MMTLSKHQSRYAALLLLLLGILLVAWLLSYPLVSLYSSQVAIIQQKENRVARDRQLVESQELLRQELEQLKSRNPGAAYYVAGETPALASARMQQYLKQIVERNGGELISTQILPKKESQGVDSTSLKVHLTADLNASWQILYALESGRPMMFLDSLVISARPERRRSLEEAPAISLDINFHMTGYLKEGA
jgi:general secretion pathway protein M